MQKVVYDRYLVTSSGDIFSFTYQHQGKQLKPIASGQKGNEYLSVYFRVNGKSLQKRIHVLVLEAFVGPRPKGQVARHLDGNRYNNKLENLAWGTPQQNIDDKIRHGTILKGSKVGNSKLTEKQVLEIKQSQLSRKEIANKYQIGAHHVWQIRTNKRWRHLNEFSSIQRRN